jgi:branched-chain amino acid transport system substrate-binding protein
MVEKSKRRRPATARRAVAFTAIAALVTAAGCGSSDSDGGQPASAGGSDGPALSVGLAIGQTGYLAAVDTPFGQGVELAVDELNKAGGLLGQKVKITKVDMASNAAQATTLTNKLINQDKVGVLVGGYTSAATAAIAPIAAGRKVPIVAASVPPEDPTWVISTLQPVTKTDAVAVEYLQGKLKASKIAVLYSQTPYGQTAAKAMKEVASNGGLEVVASLGVDTGATDLSPQLSKARSAGADAVVDVLTGPVHIVEAKSAATLGLKIPLVMGTDDLNTFKKATEAYPNTAFTAIGVQQYPNNLDPGIKAADEEFLGVLEAKHGTSVSNVADAARGWDAMMILAEAVKNAKATTGEELRAALEQVKHTGTSSQYAYTADDHSGQLDTPNPLAIMQFKGGAEPEIMYQPEAG